MPKTPSYERFPSPPPLPALPVIASSTATISADRRRLSTETSASAGWAARLAQLFPEKSPRAQVAVASRPGPAPRPPARAFSACS